MVELWLKSNINDEWISVDVDNTLTISLTKSFEEIQDFTTRKSTFSKTFTIPQTKFNNTFFQSCFMVNSSNFSSAIVVDAVVKYGGADIFNGQLRLNRIINEFNGGSYEVFLTETIPDLSISLQELKVVDLDYSGLTHTLNYDTIVSTWSYTGGSYTNYTGLTGTIVYPLANYGYEANKYYGQFIDGNSGFTSSGGALATTQFAPWISLKYLVDKSFERIGFTYQSDFFDSDYFNGIFALAKTTDTQGAQAASGSTQNANVFLAQNTIPFTDIGYANGREVRTNFNTNYYDGFILYEVNDPLNIFSPSLNATPTGRGHFFTPAVNGVYKFKVSFTAYLRNAFLPVYLNFAIKDVDDGTIYNQRQGLAIFNSNNSTIYNDIYINATLPAGRRVALYYAVQNTGGDPYADIVFTNQKWELWTSPIISTSNEVLLQTSLPSELRALDLFKGVIDHFNLVVIPTGEKSVLIEPWDDYFSSGRILDWSQKIDISSTYTIEPTNALQKEYILEFADSEDKLSFLNKQNRNERFGTFTFVDNEPFHTGRLVQSSIFQPLPISTFDDATESNILIPHLYFQPTKEDASGQTDITTEFLFQPRGSDLRLGFYQGLLDASITGGSKNIYILSGASPVAHSTYPAISHLSSYEYSASTFSDLNYRNQYDYWQVWNDGYVGFTTRDVFGDFWSGRIAQLYEPDTKIFEGVFKLTPEEIKDIQFNDRVYFLEAYWRLYEMTDADITDISLVNCKFIKLPYDIVEEPLIPPTYEQSVAPTIIIPTGSTFQNLFYSDVNTFSMCDGTATIYPYWSNCSTISAGCSVWTTSGATTYVDEGTLLKVVGGDNNIYQVVDYGILSVISTC